MHRRRLIFLSLGVSALAAAQVTLQVTPKLQAVPAQGGTFTASVTAPASVAWAVGATLVIPANMVTVKSGAGTGSGSFTYEVAPNPGAPRNAILVVGPPAPGSDVLPALLNLTQAAATAPVALSPASFEALPEGASGSFQITTTGAWVATPSADWITVLPPAAGFGNATVNFKVGLNYTVGPRQGSIAVNGSAFAIAQPVMGPLAALSPGVIDIGPEGGAGSLAISALRPGVQWTAVSPEAFFISASRQGSGDGSVPYFVQPNPAAAPRTGTILLETNPIGAQIRTTVRQRGAVKGLHFVPVSPCRLWDTRTVRDQFDNPHFPFEVFFYPLQPGMACGLPSTALAFSLNLTVVPRGKQLGYFTLWPYYSDRPFVSTLNSVDGRVKANAAIVSAGHAGGLALFGTDETDAVLDVNGYFVEPGVDPRALAFYPLPPCRVTDTRVNAGSPIAAGGVREIAVRASPCGVPASAQAYSLNATAVPGGKPLGYLTLWPTGQPQPFVSTLNAPTGATVANAAIVPAGGGGSVSAFAQGETHLVIDINGYFAPPGAAGAQRFFPTAPCRLLDSREAAGEFGGPALTPAAPRSFRLGLANCGLPAGAAAYALNATVVPDSVLGYLTLWPTGSPQPFVSTLNATDDRIVANAAIVPAGTGGAVSAFATNPAHLVVDINGYFAP